MPCDDRLKDGEHMKAQIEKLVDARGMACPYPVMLTKAALRDAAVVTCIVDNPTARENLAGMAASEGCNVTVEERDGAIYVRLSRETAKLVAEPGEGTVFCLAGETVGRGSDELGAILMRSLLNTLAMAEPRPRTIALLNSGVKLACAGSPVLEEMQALAGVGVEILACGTCLSHFGIKDQLAVGSVSNMYTILEVLGRAERVVSL